MNINELKKAIEATTPRSAWDKGTKVYMIELLDEWKENHKDEEFYGNPANMKELLNGAEDWDQYSYGGCSLIYDGDIAERLCSPSELAKNKHGERNPNRSENWLDVQARALHRAARVIKFTAQAAEKSTAPASR